MFKLYVYRFSDFYHIATIVGSTETACEKQAARQYINDDVGWTFEPEFDTDLHGLVKNSEAITIFAV